MIKTSKKANFSAFWRRVCGAGGALGREKKREGYEFWPNNFEEEFRDHTEDAELKPSTPLPTKVGRRIEGPQGGTPPPPKFGKAFEEGKRRQGMRPRQETALPPLLVQNAGFPSFSKLRTLIPCCHQRR